MAEATLNSLNAKLDTGNKIATETRDGINVLVDAAKAQLALSEQERYDKLAEGKKDPKPKSDKGPKLDFSGIKGLGFLNAPISGMIAGVGLAVGAISGWFSWISQALAPITNLIKKAVGRTGLVSKASGVITVAIKGISDTLKFLAKPFVAIFNMLKTVGGIVGGIAGGITRFVLGPGVKVFQMGITGLTKGVTKFFGIFKNIFSIFNVGGVLFNTFKAIGFVAGRIITPIIGIFGFIKGFVSNLNEGAGFFEAGKEGIKEAIRLMFTAPLDMLKNAFAWVVGKLGFENFAQSIADFSFVDLVNDAIDGIFKLIGAIKNAVVAFFTWDGSLPESVTNFPGKMLEGIKNWFSEAITNILSKFKNDPLIQNFSVGGIVKGLINAVTFIPRFIFNSILESVASLIPDSLFGFDIPLAGKARDTLRGLKIGDGPDIGDLAAELSQGRNTTGADIGNMQTENELMTAGAGGGNTTVIDASTNSTGGSTTMNMNNTSTEDRNDGRLDFSGMATRPGGM